GVHLQIHVAQNRQAAVAFGFLISKAHFLKAHAVVKWRKDNCAGPFLNFIPFVHEAEDFRGCTKRLLEAVVKEREFAHRIVQAEHGDDESDERARAHVAVLDLLAADPKQQGNGQGADEVHERRTQRLRGHGTQVGAKEFFCCRTKALKLPFFHGESFHDAVAGNALVQDVLDVGEFVLPPARGVTHAPADLLGRVDDKRNEKHQDPGQVVSQHHHHSDHEDQGEELLHEFGQRDGKSGLHLLHVVDGGRNQSASRVTGKKGGRAVQDFVVELVAQVGYQPVTGIVDQIGSQVVANALDDGRPYQRHSHRVQSLVIVVGDKLLQVDHLLGAWNLEQAHVFSRGVGIQDAVNNGAQQQNPERLQQPDSSHEQQRRGELQRIRTEMTQQPS